MRLFKYVLVAALTAAPAITFAQTTTREQPKNPVVKREFNQQRRIGNGIRNGALRPRQERTPRGGSRCGFIGRCVRCARHNHGRLTMTGQHRMVHRSSAEHCFAPDLPCQAHASPHWIMGIRSTRGSSSQLPVTSMRSGRLHAGHGAVLFARGNSKLPDQRSPDKMNG